nr:MAG TPA: hypothetical protein [Caudoviricetes sp.]
MTGGQRFCYLCDGSDGSVGQFCGQFCGQIWPGGKIYCTCVAKFGQFWADWPVLKRGWPRIWPPLFVGIATFYPQFGQLASFVLVTRS